MGWVNRLKSPEDVNQDDALWRAAPTAPEDIEPTLMRAADTKQWMVRSPEFPHPWEEVSRTWALCWFRRNGYLGLEALFSRVGSWR